MLNLSDATAKGRMNTAGYPRLAVFFLFCLFVFCGCPANASNADDPHFPFVKDGKLYSFCPEAQASSPIKAYEIFGATEGYTQKAVCSSKKDGFILAWNQKNQYLYHVNAEGQTVSKVKLSGAIAYTGKNFVLVQTTSFDQNKGFAFTLYSIKYTRNNKKISLKKLWNGNIDCFVSDCFFTTDGICISGGTQDNKKNNVFYITSRGIHKCFSTAKNSDFLRLLNTDDAVYAFLSGREKTTADPIIYRFTLDDYTQDSVADSMINLYSDLSLPESFECFFGYGFVQNSSILVLPASVQGIIYFICYDCKTKRIQAVVPDATGCVAVLGTTSGGTCYMARDALLENSFYGISFFDGKECIKIRAVN